MVSWISQEAAGLAMGSWEVVGYPREVVGYPGDGTALLFARRSLQVL